MREYTKLATSRDAVSPGYTIEAAQAATIGENARPIGPDEDGKEKLVVFTL